MTTIENLTTTLQTCSIIPSHRLQKLQDLNKNTEWIKSVKKSIQEATEMRDFLSFFNKKEVMNFLETHDMIFSTYLRMFFYKGWESHYFNLETVRLAILKSNLQSYCLLELSGFTHLDDIFKVFNLIIYLYNEILSIIEN